MLSAAQLRREKKRIAKKICTVSIIQFPGATRYDSELADGDISREVIKAAFLFCNAYAVEGMGGTDVCCTQIKS